MSHLICQSWCRIIFLLSAVSALSGCILMTSHSSQKSLRQAPKIALNDYLGSDFKQVKVNFFTTKSKELVFRVLSDIDATPNWLDRVSSLEVVDIYNNQQYLLRTIISMPWPFKDREVITCVNTDFQESFTSIDIFSCSERVAENKQFLRLPQVKSHWEIKQVSASLVEVNYQTWLNPEGNIPAFIFNNELMQSTQLDFMKLQTIIESSSLSDFAY